MGLLPDPGPQDADVPIANHNRSQTATFEDEAISVTTEITQSLADLANSLPEKIHRAVDLERSLSLDKKLAWQVFGLAQSPGLAGVVNMPARPSVRRLLDAARRRNVPAAVVERVAAAFDRFEEFVETHGPDREGLISMISTVSPETGERVDLQVRKALFRGNAHAWGVQAQSRVRTYIFNGRPGPRHYDDIVMIQAEIGLQRLRETQPLTLGVSLKTSNAPFTEGNSQPTGRWRPQGGTTHPEIPGPDLLTQFCSHPLPGMRSRPTAVGGVETELLFPGMGRSSAITLYSSIFMEDTGEGDQGVYFGKVVMTIPTETVTIDLLVPAGWTNPSSARAAIYGRRDLPEHVYDLRTEDLMPQRENLTYQGAMEGIPKIPGAPRHPEAVRTVLQNLGWLGTRFDVYRCRVQYPIMHTMIFYAVDSARGRTSVNQ